MYLSLTFGRNKQHAYMYTVVVKVTAYILHLDSRCKRNLAVSVYQQWPTGAPSPRSRPLPPAGLRPIEHMTQAITFCPVIIKYKYVSLCGNVTLTCILYKFNTQLETSIMHILSHILGLITPTRARS